MIRYDRASLPVLSISTPPAEVTRLLGLEPSTVAEKGTVLRSGRVREHHSWSLDTRGVEHSSDETGTVALRSLLERCTPAAGRFADLPDDCHARIWWSADSDSTQGGFVLTADLAALIAALGVDLYGTVYLDDEDHDDEPMIAAP